MKIIFLSLLVSLTSHAGLFEIEQYPEDRVYTSNDRGMMPYRATSLYKTGRFTLTFDDGPHPTHTPRALDILKKYQVKGTFFVLTNKKNA
jgi:peptidoglycan/xylan/chitin deacetylase (PgdA/CDA1 family)